MSAGLMCPKCQTTVTSATKFCPGCGLSKENAAAMKTQRQEMPAAPKSVFVPCRKCHAQIPSGSKFCLNCGVSRAKAATENHLPSLKKPFRPSIKTVNGCLTMLVIAIFVGWCSTKYDSSTTVEQPPRKSDSTVQNVQKAPAAHPPEAVPPSKPEPTYTVWNQQAYRSAKAYLQMQGFSKAGLIKQLTSQHGSGFTHSQAEYAVKKAGL